MPSNTSPGGEVYKHVRRQCTNKNIFFPKNSATFLYEFCEKPNRIGVWILIFNSIDVIIYLIKIQSIV